MKFAAILIIFAAILVNGFLLEAQPRVQPGPGYSPTNFRVTTFATNLDFPTSMEKLTANSIIVAINKPTGGSFFDSTGEIRRLADANSNGVSDGSTLLFTGLPGVITSVRQAGKLVFVTSSKRGSQRITVLRKGSTQTAPYSLIGSIRFAFPSDWSHSTYALAVRNTPNKSNHYDLFFNIGSRENFARTTAMVPVSGLITGKVKGDSIYKVTIQDLTTSVIVSGLQQIATGIRNAAGLAFHPETGDLYFEDNGIDSLMNAEEPLSADEVNVLTHSLIGGEVENYGFPGDYIEYRTNIRRGSVGIQPRVVFQPISGSESEGPVEIAFAPANFPLSLRSGLFIGFHGRSPNSGIVNEENPVLHFQPSTKKYFQFIGNNETKVGYLNWLMATVDSLFIGDLSKKGSFNAGDKGAIYQIKYPK